MTKIKNHIIELKKKSAMTTQHTEITYAKSVLGQIKLSSVISNGTKVLKESLAQFIFWRILNTEKIETLLSIGKSEGGGLQPTFLIFRI